MRILITNDDGIHSEGLDVCAEIGRALSDDVWVIAPEFDQSGVSHSLSLNDPLRLREIGERRFAVKGTPTDCVIMGARHVIKDRPPDLVLVRRQPRPQRRRRRDLFRHRGGRGRGHHSRHSVVCAVAGLPVAQRRSRRIGTPRSASRPTSSAACSPPAFRATCSININFPDCAPDEVKGVAVTSAGPQSRRSGCRSTPARTAAATPITGSPMCACAAAARTTAPTFPRSPTTASR